MAKQSRRTQFWAQVDKQTGKNACWLWAGPRTRGGHGRFCYGGKQVLAHRESAAMAGVSPDGKRNMYRVCGNKLCVRPEHLQGHRNTDRHFWARVDKQSGADACWLWTGGINLRLGYGTYSERGRQILAHRKSAELAGMSLTRFESIRHTCPTRLCVNPKHLRQAPGSRERFWAKVDKREGENACWVWTGSVNSSGYGTFGYEGKTHLAHRLAADWSGLPVVDWLCIRHSCRLARCVRPDHLFNATKAEVRASFRIVPEDQAEYRVPGAVYMRSVDQNGEVRRRFIAPHDIPRAKKDIARYDKLQKKITARLNPDRKKTRSCARCSTAMPGANNTRRYCSPTCRHPPRPLRTRACKLCGNNFDYDCSEQTKQYCGAACRDTAVLRNYKIKVEKHGGSLRPRVPDRLVYCCMCGDLFAHINSRPRICCGKSCGAKRTWLVKQAERRGEPAPVLPVTRFCHVCHQGFQCNALDPVTTCSKACSQRKIV